MPGGQVDLQLAGSGARMVAVSSGGDDRLYTLPTGDRVVYAHIEDGALVPWQMTLSTGPVRPRPPRQGRWVERREASDGVPLPRFLSRLA
ncbi:MAG: hypothetical protein ACTHNU_13120 [Gaiellales bacterium]